MTALRHRIAQGFMRVGAFVQAHPRFMALVGFVSGAVSFFTVNRQNRSAGIIAGLLVLSWLWLLSENIIRRAIQRWFRRELPPRMLRYLTQMIHQESLFFVLPFFLVTATWNSGQAVVVSLLVGAGVLTIIDPVYYGWLSRNRWVYLVFHTLTLFAVLLAALPLMLSMTTLQSYLAATGVALVFAAPSVIRLMPENIRWRAPRLVALMALLGLALWVGRYWVPPATLWISKVAVTQARDGDREAVSLKDIDLASLRAQGLYVYTAINAPRGLRERVFHVWCVDGREVDRIPLTISGLPSGGYRTWTHKLNFPQDAIGDWDVRVVTEAGQLIGVVRFRVHS